MLADKPKARKMWDLLKDDLEVNANWDMANYIAVKKLHYNDHGETHVKIVAANALKMLSILLKRKVQPDLVKDHGGDVDDEYLVVLSAALLHDIGNQVFREET
jgi:metal-dependent HD superfamily phosphatase/phosphodiesterase